MTDKKIKQCPFCGKDSLVCSTTFGDSNTEYYRVQCIGFEHALDCWDDTPEEAVDTWNNRKEESECDIGQFSSRVCEEGTKGCVVRHYA